MKISYKELTDKLMKKSFMQLSGLFFSSQLIWTEANSPILGKLKSNYYA